MISEASVFTTGVTDSNRYNNRSYHFFVECFYRFIKDRRQRKAIRDNWLDFVRAVWDSRWNSPAIHCRDFKSLGTTRLPTDSRRQRSSSTFLAEYSEPNYRFIRDQMSSGKNGEKRTRQWVPQKVATMTDWIRILGHGNRVMLAVTNWSNWHPPSEFGFKLQLYRTRWSQKCDSLSAWLPRLDYWHFFLILSFRVIVVGLSARSLATHEGCAFHNLVPGLQ